MTLHRLILQLLIAWASFLALCLCQNNKSNVAVSAFQASSAIQIRATVVRDSIGRMLQAAAQPSAVLLPPPTPPRSLSSSSMALAMAASRGMGMAKAKNGSKKNGEKSSSSSNSNNTPFNVNASLARLEKMYDSLTKANAKALQKNDDDDDDDAAASSSTTASGGDDTDIVTTEYVVAARAAGHVADWVPIAQFCLARTAQQAARSDGVSDPLIRASVSYYCREFSHVATLGSRVFQSVPRNLLQYSVETMDSFHKHVYEPAVQGKNEGVNNGNVMTKEQARLVLNLVNSNNNTTGSNGVIDDDKSEIKKRYRALSFEWHPDRFVGTDRTSEEIESAVERYSRIKLAYDTLNSGVRDEGKSWYQSLGGKARTDFIGPLQLLPLDAAKEVLEASGVATAISGMCPKIVQGFVTRSQQ